MSPSRRHGDIEYDLQSDTVVLRAADAMDRIGRQMVDHLAPAYREMGRQARRLDQMLRRISEQQEQQWRVALFPLAKLQNPNLRLEIRTGADGLCRARYLDVGGWA